MTILEGTCLTVCPFPPEDICHSKNRLGIYEEPFGLEDKPFRVVTYVVGSWLAPFFFFDTLAIRNLRKSRCQCTDEPTSVRGYE